eukprot:155126_1
MAFRPNISRNNRRNNHVPSQLLEVQNEINKMKDQLTEMNNLRNENNHNQNQNQNQNAQNEQKWNEIYIQQQNIIQKQENDMNMLHKQIQHIMQREKERNSNMHQNQNQNRQNRHLSVANNDTHTQSQNDIVHLMNALSNQHDGGDVILNHGFSKNYIANINYTPQNNNTPLTPQRPATKRKNGILLWDQVICKYDNKVITVSDHGKYGCGRREYAHFQRNHPGHHNSIVLLYKNKIYESFKNTNPPFYNHQLENEINKNENENDSDGRDCASTYIQCCIT